MRLIAGISSSRGLVACRVGSGSFLSRYLFDERVAAFAFSEGR